MDPYKYINSFIKFGSKGGYKPGLKRMKALIKPFGNPQDKVPIIHVAGSNGKGSTITFLKSIYHQAGYNVGVYTSPHLISFNERIEYNGNKITRYELEELIAELKPVIEKISNSPLGKPSFFEVVTSLAFIYFAKKEIDILLLEVGLGGRLDATNVVSSPLASIITGISLEHTAILGDTLARIAFEKAGIIKQDRPIFTAVRDEEAFTVIKQISRDKNADCIALDSIYEIKIIDSGINGQVFSLKDKRTGKKKNYTIEMRGEHQPRNAVLALMVVEKLQNRLLVVEEEIQTGLEKAFIPGRIEVVNQRPIIILDGAHNPEGIEKLVDYITEIREEESNIFIVLAVLGDKDIRNMVNYFSRLDKVKLLISQNSDVRALAADKIKDTVDKTGIINEIYLDLKEAIISTLKQAGDNDIICVTGSLVTVAEAKNNFESYCY